MEFASNVVLLKLLSVIHKSFGSKEQIKSHVDDSSVMARSLIHFNEVV